MSPSGHLSALTLAEQAEGLLSAPQNRLVDAHLAACADCRATALLLAAIPTTLAAAVPAPMPAQHVARLNLTLARLAVVEPVRPGLPRSDADAASVLELATGRPMDPRLRPRAGRALRRIGTVAASLVLLGAGAALGVGTAVLGTGPDDATRPSAASTPAATADVVATAQVFEIPADAAPDGHGNWVEHRTGILYVPGRSGGHRTARKLIRPDGAELVPDATGQPTFLRPPRTADGVANRSRPPGSSASGRHRKSSSPAASEPGPYLTHSGREYDEDNFASNVMDLLEAADSPGSAEPAAAPTGPGATSMQTGSARRASRHRAAGPDRTALDPQAGLRALVARCDARLGRAAQAADEGRWAGRPVTVLVLTDADPGQVTGLVVAGDCSGAGPLGPQESLWQQQVDQPGFAPAPRPTQAPRPVPVDTPAPVPTRPTGTASPPGPSPVPTSGPPVDDPAAAR